MRTQFRNVRIILEDRIIPGQVLVDGDAIAAVMGEDEAPVVGAEIVDGGGRYLSPGFVEIHAHGAGGSDFMDGVADAFVTAAKAHLAHGTTTLLPTSVAAETAALERFLDVFAEAKRIMQDGPNLPGVHVEGPYLSQAQKGAIDPRHIRNPDPQEYKALVERADGAILRWTSAPELPGALEMGKYLTDHGVLASIGHSDADIHQVRAAFDCGFTHITHLYSCTSTIVRRGGFRHPGVLESAYIIPGMTAEIIGDGCHLPPDLMRLVHRCIGPDRVNLTTDSMRCAGSDITRGALGDGDDGVPFIVEDGVAKLMDRTAFAGSVATNDVIVRTMRDKAGAPLVDCVRMMTLTPARLVGLGERKGSIKAGKDADLLLFNDAIDVDSIMIGGTFVMRNGKW